MDSFEEERKKYDDVYSGIQGVVRLPLSQVKSRYQNIVEDWDYDREWVQQLAEDLKAGKDCFPLLVSTEKDNTHEVIDGNHRLCAAHIAGIRDIPCVVVPITFEESEPFRKVESLLKKFDRHTQHRFQLTGFNKEWLAYKLNRFYINHYYRKVTLRQIKPFKYWYDLKQQFYKLRRKAKRAVMAPFMRYE